LRTVRKNKPGAGRPRTGQPWRVRVCLTLQADLVEWVDAERQREAAGNEDGEPVSRSAWIERLLRHAEGGSG
jgi:hypothetical protein